MSAFAVPYQGNAAPHLVDVVVLAGGKSSNLKPLNDSERKVLMKLCNRPLIWFTLAPWVEAGFRRFFLCVHDDVDGLYKYLSKTFPDVEFYFVLVPSMVHDRPSTTCDAVRYYVEYKDALRLGQVDQWGRSTFAMESEEEAESASARSPHSPHSPHHATSATAGAGPTGVTRDALKQERRVMAALQRDAVVLSCDTLLSGIDVERFVDSFYSSMASASVLLYRPMEASKAAGGSGGASGDGKKKGGGGGAGGAAAHPPPKPFTHTYACAMYEEDDVITEMAAGDLDAFHNHYHPSAQPSSGGASVGRGASLGGSSVHEDPMGLFAVDKAEHIPRVTHRRLHFLKDEDKALSQPIPMSMGFSARRPNMTMESHLVDPHVYVLRHWVLRYIAAVSAPRHGSPGATANGNHGKHGDASGDDTHNKSESADDDDDDTDDESTSNSDNSSSDDSSSSSSSSSDEDSDDDDDDLEDMSIRKTVLPQLISHQHALIDDANKVFKTPEQRLEFTIPQHWLHHGNLSVQLFNAARGQRLPEQGDSLRVFCTIFEDTVDAPCKAYRVNTVNNYRAVSDEILAAKCHMLHLERENELPPEEVIPAEVMQRRAQNMPPPYGGRSGSSGSPGAGEGSPSSLHRLGGGGGASSATGPGRAGGVSPMSTAPFPSGASDFPAHAHALSLTQPAAPHMFDHLSSFLLPTNPFTLKCRIRYKTLGVYITSSLLETAPETTVRITRSIIGPNVKLGENVTITDSIIMGGVEIGDGVTVARSILCGNASVLNEHKVVGCVVGPMIQIARDEQDEVVA